MGTNVLSVGTINALGNQVTITGFTLSDNNGALSNINAQSAILEATGAGISLNTAISQLDATSRFNTSIDNAGDLELINLGGPDSFALNSLSPTINVIDGSLTITDAVNITGTTGGDFRTQTVASTATNDDIVIDGNITSTDTGDLAFLSSDSILINNTQITHPGTVRFQANFGDADGVGSVTQLASSAGIIANRITANAGTTGDVAFNSTANNIDSINVSSGNNVTISELDDIEVDIPTNLTGNLIVNSGGNITQSNPFDVSGNASFTANGGAGNITLNDFNQFGSITFNGAVVEIESNSGITLSGNNFANTSLSLFGDGAVNDGGGQVTTPELSIGSNGGINFSNTSNSIGVFAASDTAGGNIILNDVGGLIIGTTGGRTGVTTLAGNIDITTTGNLNVNEQVNAQGNSNVGLAATSGDVIINSDIFSTVSVTGDGAGDIDIQAPTGSIFRTTGFLGASGGGSATLTAAAQIGTSANPIEIEATDVFAHSTVAGDIFLNSQSGDPLTVSNAITTGSDITITNAGTINAVSLAAGGAGFVLLTSTAGDINVGLITAPGDITLNALAGSIQDLNDDLIDDLISGGTITLNGTVGGASPGGSINDPAQNLEFFVAPVAVAGPALEVALIDINVEDTFFFLDPFIPLESLIPELPSDIINDVINLLSAISEPGAANDDQEEQENPKTAGFSFVKKVTQCN